MENEGLVLSEKLFYFFQAMEAITKVSLLMISFLTVSIFLW